MNIMRNLSRYFLLFTLTLFLCACTSIPATTPNAKNQIAETFSPQNVAQSTAPSNSNNYNLPDVFKNGDTIEVITHGFEDFSGKYLVDQRGKVYFLHVGEKQVAGKSTSDMQQILRKSYRECCLKNPSIFISKESKEIGTIIVDGAVDKPGAFEIKRVIHISEALALAGGVTLDANRKKVILARVINNERKIMTVDLESIQVKGAKDPFIYPNDVVFVQSSSGRLMFNEFIRTVPILSAVIFGFTR